MTILPIEDYQIRDMSKDELELLWYEIQEEADRLDEILADEGRWEDERKLARWKLACGERTSMSKLKERFAMWLAWRWAKSVLGDLRHVDELTEHTMQSARQANQLTQSKSCGLDGCLWLRYPLIDPLEQERAMNDKHEHTWLPVKTVLTGSLIMYYDCRCGETISVADYKRYGLDDLDDSPHPQLIGPRMNAAMLYHPPAEAGESDE